MNGAHLHLILNHFPVVAGILTLALLGFALVRGRSDLARTAMVGFVLIGCVAALAYMTGEPAEDVIKNAAGFSEGAVERHEEAALLAMLGSIGVGLFALGGLVVLQRAPNVVGWFTRSLFVLAVAALGVMGWTANLGGRIRHPEIQAAGAGGGGEREHGDER